VRLNVCSERIIGGHSRGRMTLEPGPH
jgi:hypothetical protein